jgi:FMN-dependent oxidoreductase (nitrilotriacetate monooxygenase family)
LHDIWDAERYEHVARLLEHARFDAGFFADGLGLPDLYKNSFADYVGRGGQLSLIDPMTVLPLMARVTRHLGLGNTISTTFNQPYQIARSLGSLDLLSRGRAAWNVVTSATDYEARNCGMDGVPPKDDRYDRADDVLEACYALWDCWEPDALVMDRASGVFADASKIHYADHIGPFVRTRGPMSIPRSPQGRPLILQAGSSPRGRECAARWADMIFCTTATKADGIEFRADMHRRLAAAGRCPTDVAVLPTLSVVIGETESIAREKQAYINEMVDPEVALALVSTHIGVDLSKYPIDQPLQNIEIEQGARGSFEVILQGTKAHGLTLGEAAKRFATSELAPQIVGTPKSVADQLHDYFESRACDGFILTPTVFPGTWEQFARSVVPELQKRGVFRTDYTGRTLREHLHD